MPRISWLKSLRQALGIGRPLHESSSRGRSERRRIQLSAEPLEDRNVPALNVVSAAPAPAWTAVPLTSLDLTFDKPVNPASVQTFDLNLLRNGSTFGTVTAAQVVPGTNNQTVRFTLSNLITPGQLTTYVRAGSFTAFNDSTDTNAAYTADYTLTSIGLSAVNPPGSLIYSGSRSGATHTFAVDAGQTITLVATALSAGSNPLGVTLRGPAAGTNPGPVLGSAIAPHLGAAAVLQTVRAPATGLYTATVSGGPVNSAPTLKVILNAAQEAEGTGLGLTNNTPATAQSLAPAFTPLTADAGAPDRAGVTGVFTGSPDHYAVALQAGQALSAALSQTTPNDRLFNAASAIQQVGSGPTDVAVGDLDGNGLPDLVFALGSAVGRVGVQYGIGTGAFSTGGAVLSGGDTPRAVRLGDINRDGKLDAVVANEGSNTIAVLLGTGTTTFSADGPPPFENPVVYDGGLAPRDLALGDLNGDGWLDVVVGNGYGNVVHVLLNNGDGTFGDTAMVNLGGQTYLTNGVAIGDVTGDGVPDIVAVTVDNANLAVLPGNGTGTFSAPAIVDPTGGATPRDVVLADFNGDNLLDAAVGHGSGFPVTILLNQNNSTDPFGTWAPAVSPSSPGVNKLAVADFNLDGHLDLAATLAVTSNPSARVWLGDGLGQFTNRLDFGLSGPAGAPAANTPIGIAATDATGDGAPDLVTMNNISNNLSVLVNAQSRLQVDLVDASGNVLAAGAAAANATSTIDRFVAPSGGAYYLRVSGVGRSDYAAVVTRGAAFEIERNDSALTPQPLDGTAGVLGHLSAHQRLFAAVPGSPGQIRELIPGGMVVRSFPAPNGISFSSTDPVGLAFDGKSLFFLRFAGSPFTLYELDPDTGAVRDSDSIGVPSNGVDSLAALAGKVYLGDMAGNQIFSFDPVTDTLGPILPFGTNNPGLSDLFGGMAGITGPNRLVATVNTNQGVRVVEIDPATGLVTSSFTPQVATPNGVVRGVAVVEGQIYLSRVDGTPRIDVYTRSGGYVDSISGAGTVVSLGADDNTISTMDWYSVEVGFQQEIRLGTVTPGDGPGEFTNNLNPLIELFDPSGSLVATGVPGSDGRNETITYTGFSSGTYKVRVTAPNNSAGEYYLWWAYSNAPQAGDDSSGTDEEVPVTIAVLDNDSDPDGDSLYIAGLTQPAHGVAVLNADGTITYTPAVNFNGNDSFTYTVSDGRGSAATATVNVGVSFVNDAPVVRDDAYTTDEDVTLEVAAPGVFANDFDVDPGDRFTYVEYVDAPQHGDVGLYDDGKLIYIPHLNYNGSDQFTYRVTDTQGVFSNLATVRITIRSVNDAPFAGDRHIGSSEDRPQTIDIQEITSDVEGDPRTVTDLSDPAHGTAALNGDGTVTYTPDANYFGFDSFTYTVIDGNGGSDTGTISFDIGPINDTPNAQPDAYATDEDTVLTVTKTEGVLANDTDVEGDSLTALNIAGPYHGDLVLNSDGSFTYRPDENYNGPDEFTYSAKDSDQSGTAPITVTITVRPVNDAPRTGADDYTTNEDTPLSVAARGVLDNDTDVEGDSLTAAVAAGPANGSVALEPDGSFVYTPKPNFHGTDTFSYTASDGNGGNTIGTVTVRVDPVNDNPTAADDAAATDEDQAVVVNVLSNDSDIDGDTPAVTTVTQGASGAVAINGDGTVTYTPAPNFNGADSFTYTIGDGHGGTATATVGVTVRPVNDAPVARGESYTVNEDALLEVLSGGLLDNDTDIDGDTLAAAVLTGPAHGTLSLNDDGTFTYQPAPDYHGQDDFTYVVSDGHGGTASAAVELTVLPVNDAPTARADSYTVNENIPLTVSAPGVVGNDSDIDGDALTAELVSGSGPAHGTLTLNADGSFSYKPGPNYTGADSFTYRVSDGAGGTSTATVNISVRDVMDVKPGSASNVIDLASESKITVAILSSATFDATTMVNVNSLRFGRTGTEDSLVRHKKTGQAQYTHQDVNGDGLLDLVVNFTTALTGLQVGDTTATLTGKLNDGTSFLAIEVVEVISTRKGRGNGR